MLERFHRQTGKQVHVITASEQRAAHSDGAKKAGYPVAKTMNNVVATLVGEMAPIRLPDGSPLRSRMSSMAEEGRREFQRGLRSIDRSTDDDNIRQRRNAKDKLRRHRMATRRSSEKPSGLRDDISIDSQAVMPTSEFLLPQESISDQQRKDTRVSQAKNRVAQPKTPDVIYVEPEDTKLLIPQENITHTTTQDSRNNDVKSNVAQPKTPDVIHVQPEESQVLIPETGVATGQKFADRRAQAQIRVPQPETAKVIELPEDMSQYEAKKPTDFESQVLEQLQAIREENTILREQNGKLAEIVGMLEDKLNISEQFNDALIKYFTGRLTQEDFDHLPQEVQDRFGGQPTQPNNPDNTTQPEPDAVPQTSSPKHVATRIPEDINGAPLHPVTPSVTAEGHNPKDRRGWLRNGLNPAVMSAIATAGVVTRKVAGVVPLIAAPVAGGVSFAGSAWRRARGANTMDELRRYSHMDSSNWLVRAGQVYTRGLEKRFVLMRAAGVTSDIANRLNNFALDGATLEQFQNMPREAQIRLIGDAQRHITAVDTALTTGVGLSAQQRADALVSRGAADELAQTLMGVMYSDDGRPALTDTTLIDGIAAEETRLERRGHNGAMAGMAGIAALKALLLTGIGDAIGGIIGTFGGHGINPTPAPVPTPEPVHTPNPYEFDAMGNQFGIVNQPLLNTQKVGDLRGWAEGQIAREHGIGSMRVKDGITQMVFDPRNGHQVAMLHQVEAQNPGLLDQEVDNLVRQAPNVAGKHGVKSFLGGQVELTNLYKNPATGHFVDAKLDFNNHGNLTWVDGQGNPTLPPSQFTPETPGSIQPTHIYAKMPFVDGAESVPGFWKGQLAQLMHGDSKDYVAMSQQINANINNLPENFKTLAGQLNTLWNKYNFTVGKDGQLVWDADKVSDNDAQTIVQIMNQFRVSSLLK